MPKSKNKHQAQQVKFVSLSQAINTQKPYFFANYMAGGASDPFLVTNETANQYVLKRPLIEDQNFYQLCLEELFNFYSPDKKKFGNTIAYQQKFNEFYKKFKIKQAEYENKHLFGSISEEIFYQRKDIFTINLIRFLAPECSPEADTFYKIKNNMASQKFYTATVFLKDYQNWEDIYQDGKISGHSIDEHGYVIKNTEGQSTRVPVKGLGYIAVLTTILGIADMKPDNWGLIDMGSHYQAVIIDSGKSLEMSVHREIQNAKDILQKSLFDLTTRNGKYVQISSLPNELLQADYIQLEVYDAVDHIKLDIHKLSTNDLACPEMDVFCGIFSPFSEFKELLLGTIGENAKQLYEQIRTQKLSAYSTRHSPNDNKFYTESYTLFAPKHKTENVSDFINSQDREYIELPYKDHVCGKSF